MPSTEGVWYGEWPELDAQKRRGRRGVVINVIPQYMFFFHIVLCQICQLWVRPVEWWILHFACCMTDSESMEVTVRSRRTLLADSWKIWGRSACRGG